jgi:hypothetical protein
MLQSIKYKHLKKGTVANLTTALRSPNGCNIRKRMMFVYVCYRHAHLLLCNSGVGGTLLKQGDSQAPMPVQYPILPSIY